jgi:tripartite motif-containing protein 71
MNGIATDVSNNVYLGDSVHGIQKFDSSGNFITKWGEQGNGDGQFLYGNPTRMAVSPSGRLYASDPGNDRLQIFDLSGNFVAVWDHVYDPRGIAFDSSGAMYVSAFDNEKVQKYDSAGTFLMDWGGFGSGDGQFYTPNGIAVDSNSHVYVVDGDNRRIQKFDSSGNFLSKWGSEGTGDGEFDHHPAQIAVDSLDNIYVTEGNRIQKFDSSGNFLARWLSPNHYYITVDSADHVLVAVNNPFRIRKYASGN